MKIHPRYTDDWVDEAEAALIAAGYDAEQRDQFMDYWENGLSVVENLQAAKGYFNDE